MFLKNVANLSQKQTYAILILPILISFIPIFTSGFVNYDDKILIFNNAIIREFSWAQIFKIFTKIVVPNNLHIERIRFLTSRRIYFDSISNCNQSSHLVL